MSLRNKRLCSDQDEDRVERLFTPWIKRCRHAREAEPEEPFIRHTVVESGRDSDQEFIMRRILFATKLLLGLTVVTVAPVARAMPQISIATPFPQASAQPTGVETIADRYHHERHRPPPRHHSYHR
jgi:hypothetical protein